MSEQLEKCRPDRDLQCYFERPSAIAAIHSATPGGFQVSGTWRQQFDWAVIEWNRDNVFEHPAFRNLPDGDLSGLVLSYEEERTNCIPMDSSLYPTVDWPYLRIWADDGGNEKFYQVRLKDYATPVAGSYAPAWAELELSGAVTAGDYVGLSFLGENHTYQTYAIDTLETVAQALVDSVNAFSSQMVASCAGARVRLTYVGEGQSLENSTSGLNGNRFGAYGFVSGAKTEFWSPWWTQFGEGTSPQVWMVTLPFPSLVAIDGRSVPMSAVRKMRWTYDVDLQRGQFERSEFNVTVSNWSVSGANRIYQVAGPSSKRVEDDHEDMVYSGEWSSAKGNFSGGTIHLTTTPSSSVSCSYRAGGNHELLVGTRSTYNGATIAISVDGQAAATENLLIPGEDVLRRVRVGEYRAGLHTVTITHQGGAGSHFYFDFLEAAVPVTEVTKAPPDGQTTLATDWDTDHSIAIPPERTAWMMHSMGFHGRVNHYVGALWFYELKRNGHQHASVVLEFSGEPQFSELIEIRIGRTDQPLEQDAILRHITRIGDTPETIAKAFELELNSGYTGVRAEASGSQLSIFARAMGQDGNAITVSATPTSGLFSVQVATPTLTGGTDGEWRTDLEATPRLNRAVRDWSRQFYAELGRLGLDVTAAFSMELQHGDPSIEAGIAQRYPNGDPVLLNTPALQTNFSPVSLQFWKEVYREMAQVLSDGGHQPYLQFGEVQWWYFPLAGVGMPFYDDYTKSEFHATYGQAMSTISSNTVDPASFPEESEFLPQLIGQFTDAVIQYVRSEYPTCRFEVLYPTDVNDTALNTAINYPASHWTPEHLDNLKTESFTYTYTRDLNACRRTIEYGQSRGFSNSERSFLVGIADSKTSWEKEVRYARAENVESIVLFALDQFCLMGYPFPLPRGMRRSLYQG